MASGVPRCFKKRVSFALPNEKKDISDALFSKVVPCMKVDIGEPIENHQMFSMGDGHQQRPVHIGVGEPQRAHLHPMQQMRPVLGSARDDPSKKIDVRKVLVRNPEAAVPVNKAVVRPEKSFVEGNYPSEEVFAFHQDVKGTYKARYAVPELYSSLRLAKKIQSMQVEENEEPPASCDVPDSVREAVIEKAAVKLNFPYEKQLYKDLVDLNVNEEILLGNAQEHHTTWKLTKDKEPKLPDFHTPSFSDEYAVLYEPSLTAIGKIRNYSGFSTYKKKVAWEHPEDF